jgi:hypothetical protein
MQKRFLFLQINTAACHLQTTAVFETVNTINASSYGPFLMWWHMQMAGKWQAWCGIKATVETGFCLHALSSDSVKTEGKQNMQKTSVDPSRDIKIFWQSRSHIKILGARWVTWSKFHTDDPQILSTTREKLFTQDLWTPRSRSVFDKKCLAEKSSSVTQHHSIRNWDAYEFLNSFFHTVLICN